MRIQLYISTSLRVSYIILIYFSILTNQAFQGIIILGIIFIYWCFQNWKKELRHFLNLLAL